MSLSELRPQYHFRQVGGRMFIWDVRKLLALVADEPTFELPLSEMQELDEPYWFGPEGDAPTCRRIAEHMALVNQVDLAFPILLCADGRVMDGMHRVVKAYIAGHTTITAKQLKSTPPPDHIDVPADALPYE